MRPIKCKWRLASTRGSIAPAGPAILFFIALVHNVVGPVSGQLLPPVDDANDGLSRLQDGFESVIERIGPSVVAIDVQAAPADQNACGSGFVVRPDGMILTSEHVLTGAMSIHVTLHDGRRYRAQRVAADPRCDLAIVHINARDLTPVEWGDLRPLRRGSLVLAFGNPLGLSDDGHAAASFGMVSAIARPLPEALGQDEDRYYGDMIQTTAPIGPGYSGGPLSDIRGRVVGVLTAIVRPPAAEGLGFAVPIGPRTRLVLDKLLAGQNVEYGYLGVQVRDAAKSLAPFGARQTGGEQRGTSTTDGGAALQAVSPGGPADRAGLRAGDVITAVDDTEVATADQLVQLIGACGPEKDVSVSFVRDAARHECHAQLARRSPLKSMVRPATAPVQFSFRGATLSPIAPGVRDRTGAPIGSMVVLVVHSGSPADRAGLTPGDIIVRVNGKMVAPETIENLQDLADDCLFGMANGGSVLVKAKP